jgi:hypothetical protein
MRDPSESPFRKYCLDRWREVVEGRLDWTQQCGIVHDFTRFALNDCNFSWHDTFSNIFEYLCTHMSRQVHVEAFYNSWEMAGLTSMSYCHDCRSWVVDSEEYQENYEEGVNGLRIIGCFVEKAEYISSDTFHPKINLRTTWERDNYLESAYGDEDADAIFKRIKKYGGKDLGERRRRPAGNWKFDEVRERWCVNGRRSVRWRKTCHSIAPRNRGHFPLGARRMGEDAPPDFGGFSSEDRVRHDSEDAAWVEDSDSDRSWG